MKFSGPKYRKNWVVDYLGKPEDTYYLIDLYMQHTSTLSIINMLAIILNLASFTQWDKSNSKMYIYSTNIVSFC